jgi:hypothetical protein
VIALLWWMPRAAEPTELPALVLPFAESEAALAGDDALAEGAPSTDLEHARRELYLAQGRAEIRADDTLGGAARRAEDLVLALAAVVDESGEAALDAVRMADTLRLERALAGEGTPTERAGEAGRFDRSLERWGVAEEGTVVAPALVLRALALARWNALFSRPLTEGLGPLHLRAYHGWLALHGATGWSELREVALEHYAAAGGPRALEAHAVLVLRSGEPAEAERLFGSAYERVGSVRLRNLGLGALERAAGDDGASR